MAPTSNEYKQLLKDVRRIIREEVSRALEKETPDCSNMEILDKKGAAELMKVSLSYINHNLRDIPHFKQGNRVLFERNKLLAQVVR